jgi:hypothetical protein
MMGASIVEKLRIGPPPPSRAEVASTRKALQEGRDMLRREGNPAPTLPSLVWRLVQDACETEVKLKDPEARFLRAGDRIGWPEVVHTYQERFESETQRLNDRKMSKEDPPLPTPPITDRTAETRMHTVFRWFRHVRGTKPRRDFQVVKDLAVGRSVAKVRNHRLGVEYTESAVKMIKLKAVQHICEALKNEY